MSLFELKGKKAVVNHHNGQICFSKIVQVHPDYRIKSSMKNRERENKGGAGGRGLREGREAGA